MAGRKKRANEEESDEDVSNEERTQTETGDDPVEAPRVGGVLAGAAWTGGSNVERRRNRRPKTVFARRPLSFANASKVEQACTKGIHKDKRLGLSNMPVSLTSWINLVRVYMEECGMDTVFRVYDGNVDEEIYLLEDWGAAKKEVVRDWVRKLSEGRMACPYDLDNLRWSGKALLASIDLELWSRIEKDLPLGGDVTGPEVLSVIVLHLQQINSASVRQLVRELEKLKLKNEPGQNVLSFGDKVLEIARRIDGTGMAPKDLTLVVASRFLECDSFPFKIEASRTHREVDCEPGRQTYESIVLGHKNHYRSLVGQELWPADMPKGNTEGGIAGLRAEFTKLKATMGRGKSRDYGSKGSANVECFSCGKRDTMQVVVQIIIPIAITLVIITMLIIPITIPLLV